MRIILIILASIIIVSCGDKVENSVLFETPQPEGLSNEKGIPKKLIGQYLNLNDSSMLTITGRLIIKYSFEDFSGKIDSVDLKEIKGDTSYLVTEYKMTFDIKVKGDSTFQRWSYYDSIFDVSAGGILRKYKGRYFLNKQVSDHGWRVTTLERIDNGVILGEVSTKEDISNLRDLTGTKSDSVFSFRLTKKELKKYLKENGFSDRNTYIKIR